MSFNLQGVSKLKSHLEDEATSWMESYINDYYKVNDIKELTQDQIDEIFQVKEEDGIDTYVELALGNLISYLENENN